MRKWKFCSQSFSLHILNLCSAFEPAVQIRISSVSPVLKGSGRFCYGIKTQEGNYNRNRKRVKISGTQHQAREFIPQVHVYVFNRLISFFVHFYLVHERMKSCRLMVSLAKFNRLRFESEGRPAVSPKSERAKVRSFLAWAIAVRASKHLVCSTAPGLGEITC